MHSRSATGIWIAPAQGRFSRISTTAISATAAAIPPKTRTGVQSIGGGPVASEAPGSHRDRVRE
ncbi:hypothetical protein C5746_25115 [Streptomyces atratus]|uniref:Uncharacterized protein n=1 Tax=Streptomyces atratus TaxID=1893 RepID=A0A2Z5JHD7_STRAR|nr:hypothetical protein C5746_25115 [Streptomyces atratus]